MKTSAISSPVNLTPGNSNAAKAAGADEGGASFGQVLSREMSSSSRANGPDSSPHRQATRTEHGTRESRPAAKATEPDAAEKAGTAEGAMPANAQATADAEQDENTASAAAAEDLLALVASLTQSPAVRPEAAGINQAADIRPEAAAVNRAANDTAAGVDAEMSDAQLQYAAQFPVLAALPPGRPGAAQEAGETAAAEPITDPIADAAIAPSLLPNGANAGRTRAEAIQSLHDRIEPGRARGGAMQSLNDRVQQDAAANDDARGAKDFDGRLAQAGDVRQAADHAAARAESASLRFAATDASIAKSMQDAQAPGIGAPSAVHAQPAGVQHAQAAPGQFADRLAPRVGTPAWDQALGQKVIWMVGGEQQTASLTLNPPDLGPLQVVLTVSENQAIANFTAAQAEVRQALEAAMPKLREMLGEAGIQLGQADVSAGTPDNQHNAFAQPERSASGAPVQDNSDEPQVRVSPIVSGGQGLVDTFA